MRTGASVRLLAIPVLGLGAVLAVALLAELAAPVLESTHHDFLAFYAAGRLILEGNAAGLYDPAAVTAIQRTIIPEPVGVNGYMPFINPPFAAVAFAPLAALSPETARALWAVLSLAILLVTAAWIARPLSGRDRLLGIALVVSAFPAYHSLAESQWSILLLGAGIGALGAARQGRWTLVGLALVPFWLKPQLVVLPLLALVLARRWRAVAAAGIGGMALVVLSLPFTGIAPYEQYVPYLAEVVTSHFAGAGAVQATTWRGNLATTEGLNGLFVGYLGQGAVGLVDALWLAAAAGLVLLYALAVRRRPPGFASPDARAMLAAGIAVTLLVNPNLFAQDCVLILVALAALWPVPERHILPAIVATVAFTALILLDQGTPTFHLFTVGLLVATLVVCGRAIANRPAPTQVATAPR